MLDSQADGRGSRPGFSPGFQFAAAAFVMFLALFGSHLATPLYPMWQKEFGLSTGSITLIFACYPLGVTAGLLWGGRLGDQFGRKPLILAGIFLTAAASLIYIAAAGMTWLVAARLVNGIAIGLMSGPAVAAIVELHPRQDRSEASRISAIATLASPAVGLLVATLIVHFVTDHDTVVTLPFLTQFAFLAAALMLLGTYRETILPGSRRTFREASFAPQGLRVPPQIKVDFIFASVTGALSWANTGLWLALGPALVFDVLGATNRLLGGLTVVVFLTTAGVVQLFTKGMPYRRAIMIGMVLVPPSVALIVATLIWKSAAGLVAGAIMAGAAQGLSWMGCTDLVNRVTPSGIRASVLSGLYVSGYFGAAIPIIVTGVAADRIGLFSAVILLCAVFSLLAVFLAFRNRAFAAAERIAGTAARPAV